ncbi:MAG: hypothetical protein PHD48_09335, partial [Alphaproteobacteria bacterium]|nr:hypothetical protein [Alphaproteobacteria bacterium]
MLKLFSNVLIAVLAMVPVCAAASDVPWKNSFIDGDVQAVCDKAHERVYPPQDSPLPADSTALRGCSSRNLYYGIKTPVDYKKARACAFVEVQNEETVGAYVLMMVYANGYGVSKDLDLALKGACEGGGDPAEIKRRVQHLTELKTK